MAQQTNKGYKHIIHTKSRSGQVIAAMKKVGFNIDLGIQQHDGRDQFYLSGRGVRLLVTADGRIAFAGKFKRAV
jgi:hypothetical protein